jgi:hypothetical protein
MVIEQKQKFTFVDNAWVTLILLNSAEGSSDVNNQINSPGNYHQNSPGAIQKNLISFSPPGHRFSRYF